MLRLKDRSRGVPDGFRYTHAETGFVSTGINWWDMWSEGPTAVIKHRAANRLPSITEAEAEDQLCQQIGPAFCQQEEPGSFKFVNTRLRWGDIVNGTKAYVSFILSGFQSVSQNEANRRGRICGGCYLRVSPQGCGACVKIAQLVTGEIAGRKTQHDSLLANKACGVCSCPVASLVWFPMPLLEKPSVDSPEKQEAYPMFCWRKRDGINYQPEAV